MSGELCEAITKAGGKTSVCIKCLPNVEGHTPLVGLQTLAILEDPKAKINIHTRWSDAVEAARYCWVCGWMVNLVKTRCAKSLRRIDQVDYSRVWVGTQPHTIPVSGRKRGWGQDRECQVLTRITVYFDTRAVGGYFDYFIFLQKSDKRRMHLRDLLDRTDSLRWPIHEPFTSRLRPLQADVRLIKRWKDHCTLSHGSECNEANGEPISAIRLIDVGKKCVVDDAGHARWVTLSYCWGGDQEHSLKKDNLAQYRQPGSLSDTILPPVIFDAMLATEALGEQYLWVDSLCIIQDDEMDKLTFLSVMDAIYAHAVVTIINAAGGDTSGGLPGIGSSHRRRDHEPFQLNGTWLTECLDPPHSYYGGYLEKSTWGTRGWTYQEALLSRRCLVFTADQIYWQCPKASWCEGGFWEQPSGSLQIFRHFLGDTYLTSLHAPLDGGWIFRYLPIVDNYLGRQFTAESDRLYAIIGILKVFRQVTGVDHVWGMPKSRLEHSLAFTTPRLKTRRELHKFISPEGKLASCPFPTWSWVGWQGRVDMEHLYPTVLTGTLGLRFYQLDMDGSPCEVSDNPPQSTSMDEALITPTMQLMRYPTNTVHSWLNRSQQTVHATDVPGYLHSNPLARSLLCFYTSTAILSISHVGWDNYHNGPRIITGHGDVAFAGLWGHSLDRDPQGENGVPALPEFGKFIVIGAARKRPSHGGELTLKLLLVETGSDGIVSRRKNLITEVLESNWEELENRRWELVFLG